MLRGNWRIGEFGDGAVNVFRGAAATEEKFGSVALGHLLYVLKQSCGLTDANDEYAKYYVKSFEHKYGKGSWERTLAEKRKEEEDHERHRDDAQNHADENPSSEKTDALKSEVNRFSDALKHDKEREED